MLLYVDVGAASMYTNDVSAYSTGTGGKKNDAGASTSDVTAPSGKGKVDKKQWLCSQHLC